MDLEHAIAKHAEWKLRLRSAIFRQDTLDAERISQDYHCELGQWLHSDARIKFGSSDAYHECVKAHAHFHKEAARVAIAINAKRYADAERMLEANGPYSLASNAVRAAILVLQDEAAMLLA